MSLYSSTPILLLESDGLKFTTSITMGSPLAALIQDFIYVTSHYSKLSSNGEEQVQKVIETQYKLLLDLWKQDRAMPLEIKFGICLFRSPLSQIIQKSSYNYEHLVIWTLSCGQIQINSTDPAHIMHIHWILKLMLRGSS